ncbi:MAG: DUF2059 domain-containing protein [Sphingopyxis sp.]|nr:DUF2059 domain-containing protein [Sphingopyxis sp.]
MFKLILKSAAAPLALIALTAAPVQAAPITPMTMLANPAMGGKDAAGSEAAIMEMFAKLFDTGNKTPIDPAQLALGQTTASKLLPDGAYGRMMEQMMGQFIKPILALDGGLSATQISLKTGIDDEAAEKLTEDQRSAVEAILDPNRQARNEGMINVLNPLMMEAGKALEGPMREGIARAYARKFSAAQLNEVNAFFATPAGAAFAAESFAIQGDPEVLSATFQAMPVMLAKFMGSGQDLEAKMQALPQERKIAELNLTELQQLAGLLGTTADALKAYGTETVETALAIDEAAGAAEAAGDAAEAAAAEAAATTAGDGTEPWFDRANWDAADRAKVEAFERQAGDVIGQQIEAEDAAVERARKRLHAKDGTTG